jgi:hypothetical protein
MKQLADAIHVEVRDICPSLLKSGKYFPDFSPHADQGTGNVAGDPAGAVPVRRRGDGDLAVDCQRPQCPPHPLLFLLGLRAHGPQPVFGGQTARVIRQDRRKDALLTMAWSAHGSSIMTRFTIGLGADGKPVSRDFATLTTPGMLFAAA